LLREGYIEFKLTAPFEISRFFEVIGPSLKLVNNRYHYDFRKFSFAPRIVNVWNSLPEIVISADTTDTFKRRLGLDTFWQHQDILYNYKVDLTGVGNRSQINADDNIVI